MGRHSGVCSRGSKRSSLIRYTTDCGGDNNENDDFFLSVKQRSISLTALNTGNKIVNKNHQQTPSSGLEPRMAQLETLEAKMASIEVSLSTSPRRKKGGSITGVTSNSPAGHRARDIGKELDTLRVALRDKENIIQNLKGQLCNTLSNRLSLRNGGPSLTESDRKAAEDRLQRLRRDADNKRLAIKNLKLALERLDITDNIDVRIQQAELEYRLGREELELLTLREESRALQAALELADTQEKQKNHTIFSCISGSTQVTVHALEVSADPKSPRFGAGPRDDAPGLYVDWAVEDSGLCKGDRILEVNGKLVVGAGRSDLARLLAVAPDAAQIVVLRKGESLAALRTLRSDNLRLTHRIGYLEEQVRDLLTPSRVPASAPAEPPPSRQEHVQVFQKGPQVTALVANLPGLGVKTPSEFRQSLPTVRTRHGGDNSRRLSESRTSNKESDFVSDGLTNGNNQQHKSKTRQRSQGYQLARSTASLDCKQNSTSHQIQRRPPRAESAMEQVHKNRRNNAPSLQSLEFDSEPTYYRLQDSQSRVSEQSDDRSTIYSCSNSQLDGRTRPTPPKKPLRLSLHRAASLQSVESAPPTTPTQHEHNLGRKPVKRNHRGDPPPPLIQTINFDSKEINIVNQDRKEIVITNQQPPQPPPRTPSRAESCQSALRWPSPRPRPQLASVPMEKWC